MARDQWLILGTGALFLLAVFSGAIADRWRSRRRRRAADELTRLWDDGRYFDA